MLIAHRAERQFCCAKSTPCGRNDYTSFSLNLDHALTYAGGNFPTLLVLMMDTAGNQPFSGEWEFTPSPGTTWRQLTCEIPPTNPNGTAVHGRQLLLRDDEPGCGVGSGGGAYPGGVAGCRPRMR